MDAVVGVMDVICGAENENVTPAELAMLFSAVVTTTLLNNPVPVDRSYANTSDHCWFGSCMSRVTKWSSADDS